MDLTNFFVTFVNMIKRLFQLLDQGTVFYAFGQSVSLLNIICAFIVLSMVISLFWKGAKA